MKFTTKSSLAAALAAGLLIAAPQFALAEADTATPDAPREHGGRHHGGHHGGPFLREVKSLDLSDTQRSSIRTAVKASFDAGKAQHDAQRSLRRQLMTTAPGSAGYSALVNQLADAEANAARDRVQRMASLNGEVYAMLNAAQKAQLTEKLKNLPEPPARGERTGWKPR